MSVFAWVLGLEVEVVCVLGGACFSLFDHEPESQENKMTTRMDGRTKEKENKKGNLDRVQEQNMNLWS